MIIDGLIIILFVLLAIFGYMKGFIVGILNLIFLAIYSFFADDLMNIITTTFKDTTLVKDMAANDMLKYFVMVVIGLVLGLIVNIILRKIIRKSLLSGFDHIGGMLIHIVVGYLILCVILTIYGSVVGFLDAPEVLKDSYFFSSSFEDYNIIVRWWLNAK